MTANELASLQGSGFPVNILRLPGSSVRALAGFFALEGDSSLEDIRVALRDLLAGFPAIAALTSTVELRWISQSDPLPAITLSMESIEPTVSINNATDLAVAGFAIDVWATDQYEAIQISRAVYKCLHMRLGAIPGGYLHSSRQLSERDLSEAPDDASDRWIYRINNRYQFQYRTDLP